MSLARLYHEVAISDVPFAQDCVGDQYILRDDEVWRLHAETGELENAGSGLFAFVEAAVADLMNVLEPHPLIAWERNGNKMKPGELLLAYPPYCVSESSGGSSLPFRRHGGRSGHFYARPIR